MSEVDFYSEIQTEKKKPFGAAQGTIDFFSEIQGDAKKIAQSVKENPAGSLGATGMNAEMLNEVIKNPDNQRALLELAGGVAGSMVAPEIGIPKTAGTLLKLGTAAANLASRTAGAFSGGAAASGVAESFNPTEDPTQSALKAGTQMAAGEVIATPIIAFVRKVIAPFRKSLIEGGEEAFETLAKEGTQPTPGQVSDSALVDLLENVSEASMVGGKGIINTREAAAKTASRLADDFAEWLGKVGGADETGLIIRDIIDGGRKAFHKAARKLYNEVDQAAQGVSVSLEKVIFKADELGGQFKLTKTNKKVKNLLKDVTDLPETASFSDIASLRSEMLEIARTSKKPQLERVAKSLAKELDATLENAGKNLKGDALTTWRRANEIWKEGAQTFNSNLAKRIARADPDNIFKQIVKNKATTNVKRARDLINDPDTWKLVQSQSVHNIIEVSRNASTKEISGSSLLSNIKAVGDRTFAELLGKEQAESFIKIAKIVEMAQARATKEGTGKIFIQLQQAGAVGILLGSIFGGPAGTAAIAGGTAIILGPAIAAKALTTPSIARLLTVGFNAPKGSALALRTASQLTSQLVDMGAFVLPKEALNDSGITQQQN